MVQVVKVPIPELTAKLPNERLMEFYEKIGWDRQCTLDPMKVRITRQDHMKLYENEMEHALKEIKDASPSDIKLSVGFLWMNNGPSCEGETPGMVELLPGWMTKEKEE